MSLISEHLSMVTIDPEPASGPLRRAHDRGTAV